MSPLQKHRKSLLRLLPVIALSVLTVFQPSSVSIGAGGGRDYARCIVECNSARRSCRSACRSSCRSAYAGSWQNQQTCVRTCTADCNDIRETCRETCKVIKPPPSNPVP